MSKHTPGPWLAVSNRSNTALSCISDKDGYTIATCNNVSVGDWEANARLIAAAPELIDALITLLTQLDEACSSVLPTTAFQGSRIKARAAITKAKAKR